MSDEQPRRRGRPSLRLEEKRERVEVTLTPALYDRTYSAARRSGVAVAAVIRNAIQRTLDDDDSDD